MIYFNHFCFIFRTFVLLYSKSYLLQGGTVIYSNANLNDDKYKIVGNYYCNNSAVAASLQNAPFSVAFTLKVEQATGASEYPCQTARNYQTGAKAWREYNPYSRAWTNWVYFSDDTTLFAGKAIQSGDDLNDYITPGIYYSQDSAITATLLNMPESFASGFSLDVKCLGSSDNLIQTITYTSVSGAGSVIYTRRRSGSLWSDWYKFNGTVISS